MTTDRPYRDALDREEALRRLEQAAGTQFDPRVVDVCLRVLEHAPAPEQIGAAGQATVNPDEPDERSDAVYRRSGGEGS